MIINFFLLFLLLSSPPVWNIEQVLILLRSIRYPPENKQEKDPMTNSKQLAYVHISAKTQKVDFSPKSDSRTVHEY